MSGNVPFRSGVPVQRQVDSRWIEEAACDASLAGCPPEMRSLAKAIVLALKEHRPAVILPPQNFMPFHNEPFLAEDRAVIIPAGNTDAAITTATAAASNAEHIRQITDTSPGWKQLANFKVPYGHIAVLSKWGAQPDPLGFDFIDAAFKTTCVQFQLEIQSGTSMLPTSLQGVANGSVCSPFQSAYLIPEDMTIAVAAVNNDPDTYHFVDSFLSGYLVPVTKINDTYGALLEGTPQPKRVR